RVRTGDAGVVDHRLDTAELVRGSKNPLDVCFFRRVCRQRFGLTASGTNLLDHAVGSGLLRKIREQNAIARLRGAERNGLADATAATCDEENGFVRLRTESLSPTFEL